jgi:hypothetical protein
LFFTFEGGIKNSADFPKKVEMKKKRKFVWQQKIEKYCIFLNIEKLGGEIFLKLCRNLKQTFKG